MMESETMFCAVVSYISTRGNPLPPTLLLQQQQQQHPLYFPPGATGLESFDPCLWFFTVYR
jgi:hypothetical protein